MSLPPIDPARLEQEWQADQEVLAELVKHGDRPEIPRPVDVSFRGPAEVLDRLAEKAAELDFAILDIEESKDGDPWLFLVRDQPADPESIRALTLLCLQWEVAFGVEYDGWGCGAETGSVQ